MDEKQLQKAIDFLAWLNQRKDFWPFDGDVTGLTATNVPGVFQYSVAKDEWTLRYG